MSRCRPGSGNAVGSICTTRSVPHDHGPEPVSLDCFAVLDQSSRLSFVNRSQHLRSSRSLMSNLTNNWKTLASAARPMSRLSRLCSTVHYPSRYSRTRETLATHASPKAFKIQSIRYVALRPPPPLLWAARTLRLPLQNTLPRSRFRFLHLFNKGLSHLPSCPHRYPATLTPFDEPGHDCFRRVVYET